MRAATTRPPATAATRFLITSVSLGSSSCSSSRPFEAEAAQRTIGGRKEEAEEEETGLPKPTTTPRAPLTRPVEGSTFLVKSTWHPTFSTSLFRAQAPTPLPDEEEEEEEDEEEEVEDEEEEEALPSRSASSPSSRASKRTSSPSSSASWRALTASTSALCVSSLVGSTSRSAACEKSGEEGGARGEEEERDLRRAAPRASKGLEHLRHSSSTSALLAAPILSLPDNVFGGEEGRRRGREREERDELFSFLSFFLHSRSETSNPPPPRFKKKKKN